MSNESRFPFFDRHLGDQRARCSQVRHEIHRSAAKRGRGKQSDPFADRIRRRARSGYPTDQYIDEIGDFYTFLFSMIGMTKKTVH